VSDAVPLFHHASSWCDAELITGTNLFSVLSEPLSRIRLGELSKRSAERRSEFN
jgi:hypothetical protein